MKEQEYRNYIYEKANKIKTKQDLDNLLEEIVNDNTLDYGTIVYAICGGMIATAKFIDNSEVGGITGFQAGFIAWEMIKKFLITCNKTGMKIVDYDEMLYPQYKYKFNKTISKRIWENLQKEAQTCLKECKSAHPKVIAHWQSIVDGKVPFGYKIKEE